MSEVVLGQKLSLVISLGGRLAGKAFTCTCTCPVSHEPPWSAIFDARPQSIMGECKVYQAGLVWYTSDLSSMALLVSFWAKLDIFSGISLEAFTTFTRLKEVLEQG
jgi:hypothetical protein